jgi:hypothetical protein
MQPVPADELEQVSGGDSITILPGKTVVVPVVQINLAVLANNLNQLNIAHLGLGG